ncbi:MAG: ABC transporter permease [Actinomycetota bacterium]|nr:ABC transporter permease [Actinomycetota bacterium]
MATAASAPQRNRPPWVDAIGVQLLALGGAFAFAAAVGSIIIIGYDENPLDIYVTVWRFSTARPQDFAQVLENATPLIFSGLSVAVAFKAGMFNIGTEGQYIVGMMTAAAAALAFDFLPAFILLPAVILAAVAGGVAWASVPAVLKVKTGAHEVVTTIMMNGIAISLVAWAILNPLRSTERKLVDLRTDIFSPKALVPDLASSVGLEDQIPGSVHLTWLFPIALLACVLVWLLLFRTRLGYETRAVGSSPGAAEAGGISIGAAQIKMFLISGGLAGFVGLNHLLGDRGFLGSNYEAGLGFAGIAVAFLGRNHPAGIPLAAILIGMLMRGQDGLAIVSELPTEVLIILQGVLILSVVVAYELVNRAVARRRLRDARSTTAGGQGN